MDAVETPAKDETSVLVSRAQEGDKRAVEKLIREIYPPVLRYTRARISGGRTPTAEDVAQEVMLAVVQALDSYVDQGKPFLAFVYGIAFNKVADAHRAQSRDPVMLVEETPEEVDSAATPEESALILEGCNRARGLLDLLSERNREILILRIYVGLSAEETARVMGTTAGAVRVAQHRALSTLRKSVEEGEYSERA